MQPNGSPVEYPTVSIDGVHYPVKFSNRALYRLDKAGVDLRAFGEKLKAGRIGVSMIYDLLSAALLTPQHVGRFDAEDLADKVSTADATKAVLDAMGKVPPHSEVKLQEPAAKSEPLQ